MLSEKAFFHIIDHAHEFAYRDREGNDACAGAHGRAETSNISFLMNSGTFYKIWFTKILTNDNMSISIDLPENQMNFSQRYRRTRCFLCLALLFVSFRAYAREIIIKDGGNLNLNLMKAKETVSATGLQLGQASENLELASLRYQAELVDPLEVTDASVSDSKAKPSNISALYGYKTARVNIEKAMGNR